MAPLIASALFVACDGNGSCPDCTIVAHPFASFGESDGDGALANYPVIGPEVNGARIVLQPEGANALPRLYDADGRFLRLIGREGDGPGEYRRPGAMLVSGDSVLFFDSRARRLSVWHPRDGAVRSAPWRSFTFHVAEMADGSLVSTDALWRPGRPFEHVSREGEPLGTFGDSVSAAQRVGRLLFSMPDRSFWTAPRTHRLVFEHWRSPAERLARFEVVTPHYAPYDELVMAGPDHPQSPSLRGFWVDSLAHLWLVIEVPGTRWNEGYGPPQRGEGGRSYRAMTDRELAWDSVILRYDIAAQRIVAEQRFDEAFMQVVEPGVVSQLVQDDDGWYQVTLHRISLDRR